MNQLTIDYRIIIPVFNPSRALFQNLALLESSNPGSVERVFLVDDGSTNGIPQEVEQQFPGVTRIEGNGMLWWCGAMRLGMQAALNAQVDVVVWLNHDCVPGNETISRLVALAAQEGNGAVSAWCRSVEADSFPVNPGFRNFKKIPLDELRSMETVRVDGVNGNCVAINATAIRAIGLPDSDKHPHYGDGPYTYRLHQAGYKNLVCTTALAYLEREYDRCISIAWRCAFWNVPLKTKLTYYFFSRKSKFHWSIKYHDIVAFRGYPLAPLAYTGSMLFALREIIIGHQLKKSMSYNNRLSKVCKKYSGLYPKTGLIQSLTNLENAKF